MLTITDTERKREKARHKEGKREQLKQETIATKRKKEKRTLTTAQILQHSGIKATIKKCRKLLHLN